MAKSQATIGLGTEFLIGDDASPPHYTSVTEAANVTFADYTVTEVDVTHLLSPDSTEETIAGLKKTGTIEVTGNYVGDEAQQSIDVLASARTMFPWKITSPLSGTRILTVSGYGFINKKETGPFTPGAKTEFKIGVKVAGMITYAIAP